MLSRQTTVVARSDFFFPFTDTAVNVQLLCNSSISRELYATHTQMLDIFLVDKLYMTSIGRYQLMQFVTAKCDFSMTCVPSNMDDLGQNHCRHQPVLA